MEPEKKSNGAIVGLVVIIIILLVGGIYMWMSSKDTLYEGRSESTVTDQDSKDLDTLEQDAGKIDANTGVDAGLVY